MKADGTLINKYSCWTLIEFGFDVSRLSRKLFFSNYDIILYCEMSRLASIQANQIYTEMNQQSKEKYVF